MKAGLISLGCSKNRVDSEILLGELKARGFQITPDASEADVIIVNTCGFIEPAKQESINTTLEMAANKTKGKCSLLVMCGCVSQRYPNELASEMPEVDILWGVHDQAALADAIALRMGLQKCDEAPRRILTTPDYSAYLRIADGCDNRCSYCAIPLIRGGRCSIPMEELVSEAEELAGRGVSEITLIAQDTSAYGQELYGKPMLAELMKRIAEIDQFHWVRVLYTYPNTVDSKLLYTMAENPKIVPYMDIPIQHISDPVLKRMNRHGDAALLRSVMRNIHAHGEDFILRTTVMVGFPGETDEDFDTLMQFLSEEKFDRLGAFAFSPEDGTAAAEMPDQVPDELKTKRLDRVMALQQKISLEQNRKRVGKTYEVLVEKVEEDHAYGRSYAEAPEVDGMICIKRNGKPLKPGEYTQVRIIQAKPYDLIGEEQ